MVRRGLTLAGTEGLYSASLRNTHGGSQGNVTTIIDVYNLGVLALPPFPTEIPENMDFWITGLSAEVVSGTGFFGNAFFDLSVSALNNAFGTFSTNIALAGWRAEVTLGGPTLLVPETGTARGLYTPCRVRVPRNATLRFHTRNNGANSPVYQCNLLIGLFPSSMGQDGFA